MVRPFNYTKFNHRETSYIIISIILALKFQKIKILQYWCNKEQKNKKIVLFLDVRT
ncbi:hypothetical protein TSAR_010951 [Trichomalopsis sarcophagae]|uniref:Uncharacterized protein n=1 Tax=Trichomalopsis sarcophagae TaxID=543379 RepID=A0A232FD47_9HYME|nr:hypothetical protein TSAR_010951 [Trichomalopsis sarcophagae]